MFLRATLQAQSAEYWCSQRGALQTQMPNEATDGLAPSVLDSFSGAVRAASYEFPSASEKNPRREIEGSDSHHVPDVWCSCKRTRQAQKAEDWCSQKGTLQTQISNEATDGLAPSVFAIFRAQLKRLLAFFRQRAEKTRGEKPRVRIRIVLPKPGAPGQGHCRPKLQHGF